MDHSVSTTYQGSPAVTATPAAAGYEHLVSGRLAASAAGWVSVLFVAGLLARAATALIFAGEIDGEGAEYARIAQNLLAGNGYAGIATPGTQLFFPPLFPFMMALVGPLAGDVELAGRLINVAFGALLVVPVYFIARRLFGEENAAVAAAIAAFHPYLVAWSTTVFCETVYLTLLTSAICLAMSLRAASPGRAYVATGLLYGAGYLVRPEGLVFMLVGTAFALAARVLLDREPLWRAAGRLAIVPIVSLAVASPYVAWLSVQTGTLRIEGKSPLNTATEARRQSGMSTAEAAFGMDRTLAPTGVWNRPNIEVIAAPGPSLTAIVYKKTREVAEGAAATIAGSLEFGSPALFALACFGLFGRPWRPAAALNHAHLIVLAAMTVLSTYFIYYASPRFYLLFLVLFSIWAAPAFQGLGRVARASAALAGLGKGAQRALKNATVAGAVAAVFLPAAALNGNELVSARSSRAVKSAASALGEARPDLRIADTSTLFAFHARAQFVPLPYCDESTALRFLVRSRVTHVVLRIQDADTRPYLRKWNADGVPNATRVATVSARGGEVQVFELAHDR